MEKVRYNKLNAYYRKIFGERVLKICIDGGFTCPNRDGKVAFGGCIFCSERGSGEHLLHSKCQNSNQNDVFISIQNQVKSYLSSYKASRANKFIVYFQNFSNTYDSLENLKRKYDSALCDERIVGICIATRPDCIDDKIANLISSYKSKYYVCVELGLQTSNDNTQKLLNSKYTSKNFEDAINILKKYDINTVAHIMIGLPGETKKDLKNTLDFVNKNRINGVKIHSTYIVKNTFLEKMYLDKKYTCLSLEEYIDLATFSISNLSPSIVIHRISGDAPKDILVAPEWNLHKKWIINGIEKNLKLKNISQGDSLKNYNE